ncbi:hypothetical protein D3C87_2066490 [compost metagenome]
MLDAREDLGDGHGLVKFPPQTDAVRFSGLVQADHVVDGLLVGMARAHRSGDRGEVRGLGQHLGAD